MHYTVVGLNRLILVWTRNKSKLWTTHSQPRDTSVSPGTRREERWASALGRADTPSRPHQFHFQCLPRARQGRGWVAQPGE